MLRWHGWTNNSVMQRAEESVESLLTGNSHLKDEFEAKLHIVTCIFNPENYQARYRLYRQFSDYIAAFANVELWTVELAIGDQEFAVTSSNDPRHLQLRADTVLWYKTNLLNILIKKLPLSAKYIAWIDADVEFTNQNWAQDTITVLQQYPFVQMFDKAHYLDRSGDLHHIQQGFVYGWMNKSRLPSDATGFAWAVTRQALQNVGFLFDREIVGSADWVMAHLLTNHFEKCHAHFVSGRYIDEFLAAWSGACQLHVRGKVGFVKGTIKHFWHGKLQHRGYDWRWKILIENDFDPNRDLGYREDGLLMIREHKPKLLADIRGYFESRRENE